MKDYKIPYDGGTAFPYGEQNFTEKFSAGMTLRDWFAGMALQGILASEGDTHPADVQARVAYAYADAMLAERAK